MKCRMYLILDGRSLRNLSYCFNTLRLTAQGILMRCCGRVPCILKIVFSFEKAATLLSEKLTFANSQFFG